MPILVAFIIIALAAIVITYKTYVCYGEYKLVTKISFLLFLTLGWSAPVLGFLLRHNFSSDAVMVLTKVLYFLFGFVFFLFIISFVRDVLWMLIDFIRHAPMDNMKNPSLLQKVNIYTLLFCFAFCLYGVYEAEKNAAIKTYDISSSKIKKETRLVMLSDLHIDVDVSTDYVKNLVKRVNALNPDVIVLVGDVIDNSSKALYKQMEELKELKAKDGVYVVLGNHEFYVGAMDWGMKFGSMGFNFLNNYGMKIDDSGLYIAGIPDINAAQGSRMKVKVDSALYNADQEDYVVLLSHTPKITEDMENKHIDMMLSGHTHGGQIYPFHYFAQQANDGMLAGFYNRKDINIYISRGTRYWGPPLRIFAPSEITVFNFSPEKTNAKSAE